MDHHGGRTLAGSCPKAAQVPRDATHRPYQAISNRESKRLENLATYRNESPPHHSNREYNAPLERAHPHRIRAGVNLPPALARGEPPNLHPQKNRTWNLDKTKERAPALVAEERRDPGGSPLIYEREERFSAPKRQRHPRRALALGISAKRKEQLETRNQENLLTIQNKTSPKHKKHPSKLVSVRKNSALYFEQLSEILIEPMFRLERKSSQREANRKQT
jgi:hypothetical protein